MVQVSKHDLYTKRLFERSRNLNDAEFARWVCRWLSREQMLQPIKTWDTVKLKHVVDDLSGNGHPVSLDVRFPVVTMSRSEIDSALGSRFGSKLCKGCLSEFLDMVGDRIRYNNGETISESVRRARNQFILCKLCETNWRRLKKAGVK